MALTKKQMNLAERKYKLGPHQSLVDIHHGHAIVMDRSKQRFTVLSPHLQEISFRDRDPELWTVNLKAAYRAAEDSAKLAKSLKPVPVICSEREQVVKGSPVYLYTFGMATVEAGRVVVRPDGGGKPIVSPYRCRLWNGTPAQARAMCAAANEAAKAAAKTEERLLRKAGGSCRHPSDIISRDITPASE